MNYQILKIAILCLILLCINGNIYANSNHCEDTINILKWVDTANPGIDANRNLENDDTKYRAVHGYSLYIPGIASVEYLRVSKEKDYIIIEGTGDNFCNEEYGRLNKKAFKYAEKYNKYLIKHWHKKKL